MSVVCVTVTKDRNITDVYEDGYTPRNGFERREDGKFYKVLGDPRCISDIKKKEALEAKQAYESRKLLLPPFPVKPEDKERSTTTIISGDGKGCPRIVKANRPTTVAAVKFYQYGAVINTSSDGKITTLVGPDMSHDCGFEELDIRNTFFKIELDDERKTISIWYSSSGVKPDCIIVDALE